MERRMLGVTLRDKETAVWIKGTLKGKRKFACIDKLPCRESKNTILTTGRC